MSKNLSRNITLLAGLLMLGFSPVSARQLTPDQALEAARKSAMHMPGRIVAAPKLSSTLSAPESDRAALYVFTPASGEGFMVLSADDVAVPVLAYSESGSLDMQDIAPGAKAWLDNYAAQIAAAAASGGRVVAAPAKAAATDIAPLVKTQWNQDAPYNNMVPMSGSSRCVTGCVATAISQVLKVHQWPTNGVGTESYTWNKQTLSYNFASANFDWANMLDTYPDGGASATQTQRDAVANLMYAAGVAAHMDYAVDGSAATGEELYQSLISHLRYDKSIISAPRDYYLLSEWTDMLYTDLAAGRPVFYTGATIYGEGHAFVLDGYRASDGFFHVNWGWGGMSDGYFAVTELDPDSQGIGGGSAGFVVSQSALFGLKPAVSGSSYTPLFVAEGFDTANSQYSRTGYVSFTFGGMLLSYSLATLTADVGVKLVNKSTGATSYAWWDYDPVDVQRFYGFSQNVLMPGSDFPTTGSYTVTPVVRVGSRIEPVHVAASANRELNLTCSGNTLVFSETSVSGPVLDVVSVSQPSEAYPGYDASVNVTVKNTGDAEYSNLLLCAFQYGNSKIFQFNNVVATVAPDNTATYTFTGTIPEVVPAGQYDVLVVYLKDNKQVFADTHSAKITVSGSTVPEPEMTLLSVEFPESTSGVGTSRRPWSIPVDPAKFNITVQCTDGAFEGVIGAYLYNGNTEVTAVFDSNIYKLAAGQSKTVSFSEAWDSLLEDEVKYTVRPFYGIVGPDNKIHATIFTRAYYITKDVPAGIADAAITAVSLWPNPAADVAYVEAEGLTYVEVYSSTGALVLSQPCSGSQATLDVAGLPAGLYVVKALAADGVHTLKLIKNQ